MFVVGKNLAENISKETMYKLKFQIGMNQIQFEEEIIISHSWDELENYVELCRYC